MSATTTIQRRCTGLTALWCPDHGDCRCPQLEGSEGPGDNPLCPLHSPTSDHPRSRVTSTIQRAASGSGIQVSTTETNKQ